MNSGLRMLLQFLERCFTVVVLFLSTGAVLQQVRGSAVLSDNLEGDPVVQFIWAVVYVIAALLFILHYRRSLRGVRHNKFLLAVIIACLISATWSVAPEISLRRGVALLGTSLFGVYFATRYDLRTQLRLLGWALGIAGVLSALLALAVPSYGLMSDAYAGAWRGVFAHKNYLGRSMTVALMTFLLLALSRRQRRGLATWIPVGLAASLLVLSESRTAIVVSVVLLAVLPFLKTLKWEANKTVAFMIPLLMVGGIAGTIALSNAEGILGVFDRDLTLSGRSILWNNVLRAVIEQPWTGYGYGGAFWTTEQAIYTRVCAFCNSAHNGFLDLTLDMGIASLGLFLAHLVGRLRIAVLRVRSAVAFYECWPLMYLLFIVTYNSTENVLLAQNSLFWILYVSVSITLGSTYPVRTSTPEPHNLGS